MISQDNFARPSIAPKLDELFDLLAKRKRTVQQYSRRYKKKVKFYSIHKTVDGDTLMCAISGPGIGDLRFTIKRDTRGYLVQMTVGVLSHANLEMMIHSLEGLAARLVMAKPTGFTTKHWSGLYLWAETPGDDVHLIFEEATAQGLMSEEFAQLCLEWGISIRRYPLA